MGALKYGTLFFAAILLSLPRATQAGLDSNSTVFIILMENHNWSAIRGSGSAPYINNILLPIGAHAEQYYNPPGLHPSEPNYIWLEAGSALGITNDNDPASNHQSTTNHFVTQLKNAGISWRSYQEDICGCLCPLVSTNKYAPKHNPMIYFDDVTNTNNANSAYCIANVRSYSQFASDLASNTVGRYNFITPNLCNDMHDTCAPLNNSIRQGDTWLSNSIPLIMSSAAYQNGGAIFITFDEGAGTSDGPIGMMVISPFVKSAGYSNTVHYTHSSCLRTMQKIFNVRPFLGDASNANDLSDLFQSGAIPNADPFAPDGSVDTTNYVQWATNMYIWAAVNGTKLYVSTWSPGTNGPNDHFIFVTDQLLPTASQAALPAWSKSGSNAVSTNKPYLGGESANSFVGWFNAPTGSQSAKWPTSSRHMEGVIDISSAFGSGIMTGTIYIAAAAYSTANGGALASQGPNGNGDGNIDSNEFLALSVPALLDNNLDRVYDRLDSTISYLISDAQPSGGGIKITWNSVPGKNYQVQYADILATPVNWLDLPGGQTNATTGQLSLSFTDAPSSNRIYRVKILNP